MIARERSQTPGWHLPRTLDKLGYIRGVIELGGAVVLSTPYCLFPKKECLMK
jgi:hypothetical protein